MADLGELDRINRIDRIGFCGAKGMLKKQASGNLVDNVSKVRAIRRYSTAN